MPTVTQDRPAAAASTILGGHGFVGFTVVLNGTPRSFVVETLQVQLALEAVSRASFTVIVATGETRPREGDTVAVAAPDGTHLFSGWIHVTRATVPEDNPAGTMWVVCECNDRALLVMQRYVWYEATDMTTRAIVQALVAQVNARHDTGLTATDATVGTGAVIDGTVTFDGVPLAQALDWLVGMNVDHTWWVDGELRLHLAVRDATDAPWDVADDSPVTNPEHQRTLESYRNAQWVFGSPSGLSAETTDTWTTTTGQDSLDTNRKVNMLVSASKGGAGQTTGKDGDPDDWSSGDVFFTPGLARLRLKTAEIGSASWEAVYKAYVRVVGYAQRRQQEMDERGRREHVYINENIATDEDADLVAQALLDRYGVVELYDYEFHLSDVSGIPMPGQAQAITDTALGVSGTFLVEGISVVVLPTARADEAVIRVQTSAGRPRGTDEGYLRDFLLRDESASETEGDLLDIVEPVGEEAVTLVTGRVAVSRVVPTFVADAQALDASANSITVSMPSSQAGDLGLAVVMQRASATFTPPSGWDSLVKDVGGGDFTLEVFTRILSGSEPASYQWTSNQTIDIRGYIGVFRSVERAAPVDVSSSADGTNAAPTAPSVTPQGPTRHVVLMGARGNTSVTSPGGYTSHEKQAAARPNFELMSDDVGRGATGGVAWTLGASMSWVAVSIALYGSP